MKQFIVISIVLFTIACEDEVYFESANINYDLIKMHKLDFITQYAEGSKFYRIKNKIGDDRVLRGYKNFENDSNYIISEKIRYIRKSSNSIMLICDLAGSAQSLVILLDKRKGSERIVYGEKTRIIDSIRVHNTKNNESFFEFIFKPYFAPCVASQVYAIYLLDAQRNLSKAYEGYIWQSSNVNAQNCFKVDEFSQTFNLDLTDQPTLFITRKATDSAMVRSYKLRHATFNE